MTLLPEIRFATTKRANPTITIGKKQLGLNDPLNQGSSFQLWATVLPYSSNVSAFKGCFNNSAVSAGTESAITNKYYSVVVTDIANIPLTIDAEL